MTEHSQEQILHYAAEILHKLTLTNQFEEVLHLVVDRTVRLTHCQTCALVLVDPRTEYLQIDNYHGLSLTFCNEFRRKIATSSIGRLLWTGNPILLTGLEADRSLAEELQLQHPFVSCACVQVAVDQHALGYLHVDSRQLEAFTEGDLALLRLLADLAALAIVKSRLFEENLRLERVDRETLLEKYPPFLERLDNAVARGHQLGENFSLLLLDVDNFKDIVNTFGYDTSRRFLKELSALVKGNIRPIDSAGRYGIDEIILLLEDASLEAAITLAKKIRESIARVTFSDPRIGSTVSIGAASFPENGRSRDELILAAKTALFEAQRRGRDSVYAFRGEHVQEMGTPAL